MGFSEKLRELLLDRKMKAADLARATGLSEAAVSDYLKGKKEPRGRQSIAIAQALSVSLDDLWETGFDGKANDTTEKGVEATKEEMELYNKIHDALVASGYVAPDGKLTPRQGKALIAIVNIIDLAFNDLD